MVKLKIFFSVLLLIQLAKSDKLDEHHRKNGFDKNSIFKANQVLVCSGPVECKGSFWSPKWIYTSADCDSKNVTIYQLNDKTLNCKEAENANIEHRKVDKTYNHVKYNGDIYLTFLHISKPFTNMSHIPRNFSIDYIMFSSWVNHILDEQPISQESKTYKVKRSPFTNITFIPEAPSKHVPVLQINTCIMFIPLVVFCLIYITLNRTPETRNRKVQQNINNELLTVI